MSYKQKNDPLIIDEDDEGTSGQSGSIEFTDFLSAESSSRDDLLSASEKKHLLMQHANTHEDRVLKQKELRENRKALKEGKVSNQTYQQNMQGAGHTSDYKMNPILANQAQFSGIDKQTIQLPNENVAETNNEKREELKHEYQLKHQPEAAPKFHPKPQPSK